MALAEKDVFFEPNAKLPHVNGRKKWPWMGAPGEVNWEEWMSDARTKPLATTVAPLTAGTAPPPQVVSLAHGDGAKEGIPPPAAATTDNCPENSSSGIDELRPSAAGGSAQQSGAVAMGNAMEDQAGPLAKPPPEDVEEMTMKMGSVAVA